jgi:predicted TIM-barrel fold metal-dependent hydrolase
VRRAATGHCVDRGRLEAMSELDYGIFDGDNHYYEALDAFTRHLDPALGPRVIEWVEVGRRRYHSIGGRVCRAVTNPTFDPVSPAGALATYFRGNPDGKSPLDLLGTPEPIRAEYRDRDARLRVMDAQGLERIWLFPTLGMIYEEMLKHDPEGVTLLFAAFNRWLAEDWGFDYRGRIFAAPYVTLADVDWAVREVEWALSEGARLVVMRPAAPTTVLGPRSPSDPVFDPFWRLVDDAGITVVVHAGDSGVSANGYAADGFAANFRSGGFGPTVKMFAIERAVHDFLATLVFDRLFDRFPNLRIASVENGSGFLPGLFRKFGSVARQMPGYFAEDPAETFRRYVWINPFWEDDVGEVVDLMGDDRVIFGSDWPHIEALPEPADYLSELRKFDAPTVRKIMRDNTLALTEPRRS